METDDPFVHCDAILAEGDPERRLACSFLPERAKPAITAIYAFNLEVARVRELVSDTLPGEIRLQWWRDALEGRGHGDVRANPVAAALFDAIATHRLQLKPFLDLLDARTGDLYDDPPPTLNDLEGYCGETSSALLRLSALVLAEGGDAGPASVAGNGGTAYALAGIVLALPWHASQGRVMLPQDVMERHGVDHAAVLAGRSSPGLVAARAELLDLAERRLAEARAERGAIPKAVRAAYAPLALVGPRLARLRVTEPFAVDADLPEWSKPLRLWAAAAFGRF
jgi:phytoene synthase